MKFFTGILILSMISTTVLATSYSGTATYGDSADDIFDALSVVEVELNPGLAGTYAVLKSVGGLSCTRESVVYPGATAETVCTMLYDNDAEEIYSLLNIGEVEVNHRRGELYRFEKYAGNLECSRTMPYLDQTREVFFCHMYEDSNQNNDNGPIVGMGGPLMQHPESGDCVQSLNTLETTRLRGQGYEAVEFCSEH